MSTPDPWLAARTDGAPGALRERVLSWAALGDPGQAAAARLACAGRAALEAAVRSGSDRRVALDLLAADALVTLALLAQAEADPAGLAGFARALRTGTPG